MSEAKFQILMLWMGAVSLPLCAAILTGCCSSTASEPPEQVTVYMDREVIVEVPTFIEVETGCPCGCALGAECKCNKPKSVPAPPKVNPPKTSAPKPVLVDFGAKWCAPCRSMDPAIDRIAKDFQVIRIDVDEQPDVAKKYGVTAIPRLLIYNGGDGLIWDRAGVQTEEAIRAAMSNVNAATPAVATSTRPVAASGGCSGGACGSPQRTTIFRRR